MNASDRQIAGFSMLQDHALVARLVMRSGRLGVSWIAGIAAALVVFKSPHATWLTAFASFTSLTAVTMSGFVMNDIYDRDKDCSAGKLRPIALGLLPVAQAWKSVVVLLAVALGSAYFGFGFISTLWVAVFALALFAYSPVASRYPLIKGFYTALLTLTPFVFAYDAVGIALPTAMLVLFFFYNVFREAVLDAIDLKGDVAAGIHTIASFVGAPLASSIGWMGMFVTLFFTFFALESLQGKILIAIGFTFQIVSTVMFYFRVPHSVNVTRLTLLSGVLAVSLAG